MSTKNLYIDQVEKRFLIGMLTAESWYTEECIREERYIDEFDKEKLFERKQIIDKLYDKVRSI